MHEVRSIFHPCRISCSLVHTEHIVLQYSMKIPKVRSEEERKVGRIKESKNNRIK